MSDLPKHPGRGTLSVHAGVEPDPTTGAIMTPVYLTSTYVQDEVGNPLWLPTPPWTSVEVR